MTGGWRSVGTLGSRAENRQTQSNLVARPGNKPEGFVDRPGRRPGTNTFTAVTPQAITDAIAARANEPVVITGTASPNSAVKDLATTTSKINIDQDIDIENLNLNLDLQHTYRGDLVVKLTSPSGKTVTISDRQGGSADNIKGNFDLSQFAGEKTKGEWTLTIEDKARVDEGVLKNWSLEIKGKAPSGPVDTTKPPTKPTGDPIVVVLDGGVDYRHSDLDGSMWVNQREIAGDGIDNDNNGVVDDVHGFSVGFNSGDPLKGDGADHGTHVAGIIAAENNGVGNTGLAAGKAKIMSIGGLYDGNDLLVNFERSVDYMVNMKNRGENVRVVNASFGDEYRNPADQARWLAAVKKLADADILLVAATANGNGSNMNNVADFPANVDLPNVITVASMDRNNNRLASFSSFGDKVVELAAVGDNVLSTVPGGRHERMSGTSMATPMVAATAALMIAKNPNLTAPQIREIILATVDIDSDLRGKVSTGGKLNTAAAVAQA
ncbi:MAG: S8 family serine peptidase [Blastocatellia bacterium]|nr:S8 family serine peptidase [Blastocatellia bacterium]